MRDFVIKKEKFFLGISYRRVWYMPWRKVEMFDVIKYTKGKKWEDPTYGNGGGFFEDFEKEVKVFTSPDLAAAKRCKEHLELRRRTISDEK